MSVCGTGAVPPWRGAFLGDRGAQGLGSHRSTPLAVPSRCWGCSRHPRATRRHRPCPLGRLPCPVASPRSYKRRSSGAGLLTCCPSPTPCGLGLGPTNPERIILAQEPLGLRRGGFAPPLCATHAGIRARLRSTRAPARASRLQATLPYRWGPHRCRHRWPRHPIASVPDLIPARLSARTDSTSELLRTL